MKLSKYTIEAIEHKLGIAQDTLDTLADDKKGMLTFQGSPRFYFDFTSSE